MAESATRGCSCQLMLTGVMYGRERLRSGDPAVANGTGGADRRVPRPDRREEPVAFHALR